MANLMNDDVFGILILTCTPAGPCGDERRVLHASGALGVEGWIDDREGLVRIGSVPEPEIFERIECRTEMAVDLVAVFRAE
jgi:hypothetical protein